MELFNGNHYSEQELKPAKRSISDRHKPSPYARNKFEHSKFVFSMASFDLKRTKEELFAGNRLMKDVEKLKKDVDSLEKDIKYAKYEAFINLKAKFNYHLDDLEEPEELNPENYGRLSKPDSLRRSPELRRIQNSKKTTSFAKSVNVDQPKDSSAFTKPKDSDKNKTSSSPSSKAKLYSRAAGDVPESRSKRLLQTKKINKPKNTFSVLKDGPDSLLNGDFSNTRYMVSAVTNARFVKNHVMVTTSKLSVKKVELLRFKIQRYKIYAQAFSCLIMFLIGAPLGSIIKRGGFGFPVIVSIGFFIVYYVFMSIGEKWAKEELVTPFFGVWLANFVLLPFGLFFLRQARLDARVFETDFYSVIIDQLKSKILDKFKNPKRFVLFNR